MQRNSLVEKARASLKSNKRSRQWDDGDDGDGDEEDTDDIFGDVSSGVAASARLKQKLDSDDDEEGDEKEVVTSDDDIDDNRNTRERTRKETRDWEKIHTQRLKQQGIDLEANDDPNNPQTDVHVVDEEIKRAKQDLLNKNKYELSREEYAERMRLLFAKSRDEVFEPFAATKNEEAGVTKTKDDRDEWQKQYFTEDIEKGADAMNVDLSASSANKHKRSKLDEYGVTTVDKAHETIASLVFPNETLSQALSRLAPSTNPNSSVKKLNRKQRAQQKLQQQNADARFSSSTGVTSASGLNPTGDPLRQQQFNQLTDAAQFCLLQGESDIYTTRRGILSKEWEYEKNQQRQVGFQF